jgi:succinate dehydrogenase / fumarate reductase iron-sulfur subunit
MSEKKVIKFQVKRQLSPKDKPFWEDYEMDYRPSLNVITLLMEQNAYPTKRCGSKSTPVSYSANCLEEVCGACTMKINGEVRQACTALVDKLKQPIKIEPLSKFPVERDLHVNRDKMFDNLKEIQGWIPVSVYSPIGEGPKLSPSVQEKAYNFSECMTCGCCLESCPQWSSTDNFIGPQAIAQAVLFNLHPTGAVLKDQRIETLIEKGLNICGNAQSCEAACPKNLDLIGAISEANWQATKDLASNFFGKR